MVRPIPLNAGREVAVLVELNIHWSHEGVMRRRVWGRSQVSYRLGDLFRFFFRPSPSRSLIDRESLSSLHPKASAASLHLIAIER